MDKLSVSSALADSGLVQRIYYFSELGSTSLYARDLIRRGGTPGLHGTLVITNNQTHGQGRLGRKWVTPPGKALTFTLILAPSQIPTSNAFHGGYRQFFSMLIPVSLCNGLKTILPNARIKFPNDLVVSDRKLGGILLEEIISPFKEIFICIGIGINCNQVTTDFPEDARTPPSSILMETGKATDQSKLLEILIREIEIRLTAPNISSLTSYYNLNSSTLSKEVIIDSTMGVYSGVAKSIDENGSLNVETKSGNVKFQSSQVNRLTVL